MDENKLKHLSSWDGNAFINRYGSYAPWYDDKADYNTNAKSYYDYLARINKYLYYVEKIVNRLYDRNIEFEDSNSIDFTKLGDWITSLDDKGYNNLIKITAKVILANGNKEEHLINTKEKIFNLNNAIQNTDNGLWSSDYLPLIKALDKEIGKMQEYFDGDLNEVDDLNIQTRDLFKPLISQMRTKIKSLPGKINIGHITDVHYVIRSNYWGNFPLSSLGYTHIFNIANLSDLMDVVIAGGDNTDENSDRHELIWQENVDFATTLLTYCKCPAFIGIGNHDDNSVQSLNYNTPGTDHLMTNDDFEIAYFQNSNYFNEYRNNNSNYFYYDIKDSNVRVVWLDLYQNPETLNKDNILKYPRQNTSVIQQDQILWLINNAFRTNRDIVIFTHCPLADTFDTPTAYWYNHDVTKKLITDFNAHKKDDLIGTSSDFPVNTRYDFTANTGKIIGVFSGHKHRDDQVKIDGVNYVLNTCSVGQSFDKISHWNTIDEDSWADINIDEENKQVNIAKFGRGKDMSFGYGDEIDG